MLHTFFRFTVIFGVVFLEVHGTPAPVCKEKAVCEWLFLPIKFCGKWFCYGVYDPIHPPWRNYWGVTHVCENMWKGSHAISIQCKEENDFVKKYWNPSYIGMIIPEGLPYNTSSFRWIDGTPINYTDWAGPGQGTAFQQPHNDIPGQVERLVAVKGNHWYDVGADPNIKIIPCKKAPLRVDYINCPTTTTTTTPVPVATTTPTPLAMETLQMGDVPLQPSPKTSLNTPLTPKQIRSCRI